MQELEDIKPASDKDPIIILSKCERTFGGLYRVFNAFKEARGSKLHHLIDTVDIDFLGIQSQIKDFIYRMEQTPWERTSDVLPQHQERVIILLKAGGREQFATWNKQSEVFTNAGGTQFKPYQVKFWLPMSALPAPPVE